MQKTKWKLKKGDTVEVIAGKEKGKRGKIIDLNRKKDRVYVEQVNLVKKHVKRREGQPGQLLEKEAGIHVSNVMVVDPKTDKPTRISYKFLDDGTKVRIARSSGEMLDEE